MTHGSFCDVILLSITEFQTDFFCCCRYCYCSALAEQSYFSSPHRSIRVKFKNLATLVHGTIEARPLSKDISSRPIRPRKEESNVGRFRATAMNKRNTRKMSDKLTPLEDELSLLDGEESFNRQAYIGRNEPRTTHARGEGNEESSFNDCSWIDDFDRSKTNASFGSYAILDTFDHHERVCRLNRTASPQNPVADKFSEGNHLLSQSMDDSVVIVVGNDQDGVSEDQSYDVLASVMRDASSARTETPAHDDWEDCHPCDVASIVTLDTALEAMGSKANFSVPERSMDDDSVLTLQSASLETVSGKHVALDHSFSKYSCDTASVLTLGSALEAVTVERPSGSGSTLSNSNHLKYSYKEILLRAIAKEKEDKEAKQRSAMKVPEEAPCFLRMTLLPNIPELSSLVKDTHDNPCDSESLCLQRDHVFHRMNYGRRWPHSKKPGVGLTARLGCNPSSGSFRSSRR